ncbi:MAG TPA: FAD-dependent oxidoreductase, partial [Chthoniobacterales bacterium]
MVGAGPNGLAAAIHLARARLRVLVMEANPEVGGGARSAELTLPGFIHDVCSAIHPLAIASPFFSKMPLSDHGLEWVQPEIPLAHPLDDGSAAVLMRSVRETSDRLGTDGPAYHRLMQPLVDHAEALAEDFLGPLLHWPRHPLVLARFGLRGLRSASSVARISFKEQPARA